MLSFLHVSDSQAYILLPLQIVTYRKYWGKKDLYRIPVHGNMSPCGLVKSGGILLFHDQNYEAGFNMLEGKNGYQLKMIMF